MKDTEKNKVLSQELKAQKFLSVTAPKQEKIYNKIVELDSLISSSKPKISLVILLTVCRTIHVMLVWRIWN